MQNMLNFFVYAFVTSFTPGPNNIMCLTNAGKFGFKKTTPFLIGIFIGFFVISVVALAFSATLYALIPSIKPWLLGAGAIYMLWLAWKTLKYNPDESSEHNGTNTLLAGVLLQFVNVKGILYTIMISSTYITPYYRTLPQLSAYAVVIPFIGFLSCVCWAAFGSVFKLVIKKHTKAVNTVMALLLVYCAAALVF